MTYCKVCTHPDKVVIEDLIRSGASDETVASTVGSGINRYNIKHHRQLHMKLPRYKNTKFAQAVAAAASAPAAPQVKSPTQTEEPKLRKLSVEERSRVRELLDRHFDDELGRYKNGYSDRRIGLEVDVPWRCVADLRETAYGPVLVDPDVEQLEAKISELDAKEHTLIAAMAEGQRLLSEIRRDIESMREQVRDVARRVR